ncbi:MAG: tripartite tricarboxylate transporter substrate-binding protein [Sphaerochaeta sp.]|nr:tripartite tricarboxylate transporter substrate-binding protein [Sphaerochaeta sp.]
MKKFATVLLLISLSISLFAQGGAEAQGGAFSPSRDIEWTVTSSPGGGSDIYTRMISDLASKMDLVEKNFLINYKTDGGGEVGRLTVSRTKGDLANHSLLTFNSGDLMPMLKNTDNRIENFTPIAVMAVDKQLLYIGEYSQYTSFAEVLKAIEGGKSVVIAGSKGDDIATYEALIEELGINENQLSFITNDSTSAAITSILGGHVDLCMSKPAAASQYVLAGKLKPILALSQTRFAGNLSEAPTLSEVGNYKNVEVPVWRGIVGPKDMSPEAAAYYSAMAKSVSDSEAWKNDYILKNGLLSEFKGAEEAAAFMAAFQATYLKKIGK